MAYSKLDLQTTWQEVWEAALAKAKAGTTDDPRHWKTAGRRTKAKPNGEDLDYWFSEGEGLLRKYEEWLESSGWQFLEIAGKPMIEAEVKGVMGGVMVRGFIDAVMVTPDGEIVIIDYKSGSRTPTALTQLGKYRALLQQTTGINADLGSFYMVRTGTLTEPESLTRYTPEYFGRVFHQFELAVDNEVFLAKEDSHCFSCGVKDSCYVAGGVDSFRFDPDHPKYQGREDARV